MKPFGKTCLIQCEIKNDISKEGEIYIINSTDRVKDGFWKGKVIAYGTLVRDEDKKDLPEIGSNIIMSYGKTTPDKGGTKLILRQNVYYVRNISEILGVIENE